MSLALKQGLKLVQAPIMTPQLQQAIKLLQLNHLELADTIAAEMTENPLLEEMGDLPEDQAELAEKMKEAEAQTKEGDADSLSDDKLTDGEDDFDWDSYVESFSNTSSTPATIRVDNDDLPNYENMVSKGSSLADNIRLQLGVESLSEQELVLFELIMGNLDDSGFLMADLQSLADETEMHYEDAEAFLQMIQRLDPLGIGSRGLQECLLVQAYAMEVRDPYLEGMLENHWDLFQKKNFQAIAKAMDMPLDEILESARQVLDFEPKPARAFTGDDTRYVTPDIFIHKVGDEYEILLNEDGLPKLKVSNHYKQILKQGKQEGGKTKEYVQDKLRSAVWLIRSIHNRQKTIYKVAESIVKHQQPFFEKGVQALKPMILRDVANDIGMHESTISRVTTNKYMFTPVGTYELKFFFNSGITGTDGTGDLASESVKEKIRHLVAQEDPKKPLSDQKIVDMLKSDNITIARRTVAKYRDMLGILSSSKRKKVM